MLAGPGPAPATVGGGEGTRLRRVLLRWQAPQPCRSRPGATMAEMVDPYAGPYAEPYAGTYAGHPRTPSPAGSAVCPGQAPLGGVERPRRMVRFARLMHQRVRAFRPAFGRRRLRRQSDPALSCHAGWHVCATAPFPRPALTYRHSMLSLFDTIDSR